MKLWLSAETEASVYDDLRVVRNAFEDELSAFLAGKHYDLALDSLDCIFILRNDTVFDEITRYSPKKKNMDFRLAIDFDDFVNADVNQRKSLLLETIIRAVDILATKKTINKEAIACLKNDIIAFGKDSGLL